MSRIDGMPTEFEWKIFPGITTLGFLEKIQSPMRDLQCEPEHFKDRIIFMSMCNDTAWQEKGNTQKGVNTIHRQLRIMLANSLAVIGLSWGLDQKRSGTESPLTDLTDHRIQSVENMMANFSGSGHPIFRASSAFERGELRSKGGGQKSIHFNGSGENIELLLRTVISANLLSVCGAVADLCIRIIRRCQGSGETWCT